MSDKMVFTEIFHLTQGDFDRYLRIKPYAVFNIFQEAAAVHANQLRLGFDNLLLQNRAWILLRSRYVILKQPQESQTVIMQTWPLPSNKIEYDREFRITDIDNTVLIMGTSKWGVIDLETKRLTRKSIDFTGDFYLEKNFDDHLEKIPSIEMNLSNLVYVHKTKLSDLDRYQHMNNAKYSDIILNALNLEENERIIDVQINFIHDLKLNEEAEVYVLKTEYGFCIIGLKGDKTFFRSMVRVQTV